MALSLLLFMGDRYYDKRLKEASNYSDNSHIHTITYGVSQLVLSALSPLVFDGSKRLTIKLGIEEDLTGELGYHYDSYFKISYFNLDKETSMSLYQFQTYDITFQRYTANLLLDILEMIDKECGGKDSISEKRKTVMEDLENCGFQKEIIMHKFSKYNRNRKYKALVYRCLSQEIGEAIRVDLIEVASGNKLASEWLSPNPGYLPRGTMIKKAYWEGNRFYVIADSFPKQAFIELPVI